MELFAAGKGSVVCVTHKYRPIIEYLGCCEDGMFRFEEDADRATAFESNEEATKAAAHVERTWGSVYRFTTKAAYASWYCVPVAVTAVAPPPSSFATRVSEGLRKFLRRYDVTPEMRLAARRW